MSAIENKKDDYTSKSGSRYYFTPDGVYRLSNHWGRAANCKWRLQKTHESKARTKLGFARWIDFLPDNDNEKLYFIISDDANSVTYSHKNSATHTTQILRTASETTKRIRQIRNLLANDAWTKYFPNHTPAFVIAEIVGQLIHSDKTLQQIKSELL